MKESRSCLSILFFFTLPKDLNMLFSSHDSVGYVHNTDLLMVQEGEFDLDLTYITDNIIAMGFPPGDMSSGFFNFVEVSSLSGWLLE